MDQCHHHANYYTITLAADVNIYGYSPSSSSSSSSSAISPLRGNHENTEVGKFMRDYLDVDVDAVTRKLRKARHFEMANEESLSSLPSPSSSAPSSDEDEEGAGDSGDGGNEGDGANDGNGGDDGWMWMGKVPEVGVRLDGQDHLRKDGASRMWVGSGHRH